MTLPNKQTKAVLRQRLIRVKGRVRLLYRDHCIHLSVRPSACPATPRCGVSLQESLYGIALGSFKGTEAVWSFSVLVSSLWRKGNMTIKYAEKGPRSCSQHVVISMEVKGQGKEESTMPPVTV